MIVSFGLRGGHWLARRETRGHHKTGSTTRNGRYGEDVTKCSDPAALGRTSALLATMPDLTQKTITRPITVAATAKLVFLRMVSLRIIESGCGVEVIPALRGKL
jgi:hypothetical protein